MLNNTAECTTACHSLHAQLNFTSGDCTTTTTPQHHQQQQQHAAARASCSSCTALQLSFVLARNYIMYVSNALNAAVDVLDERMCNTNTIIYCNVGYYIATYANML